MASLQRLFVFRPTFISAASLWRAALAALTASAFIVVRACGYEFGPVASYLGYFGLYVALPGVVAVYLVQGGPVSIRHAFALGLPTGFALEIFTYLGLSALEAKAAYVWIPGGWVALAVAIRLVRREWPLRVSLSGHHAGIGLGLCIAFLGTALMAASQMFSESPLADGLPTRAIFHDWVYLVSRAGVIKNNWPLDDPSLAGTPLQYHYFMMVHAAAASATTGVELTTLMLRLLYLPLGAVLVAQAYVLGRAVARNPWGGVLAALFTVLMSELSFARSYGQPVFLGLFVRWLFVSPTFFFGMIFCGALLIVVARCVRLTRCDARHYIWLLLLGAACTGAKGTVVPVLVGALIVWAGWRWHHERQLPVRPIVFAACLTVAFFVVYIPMMSAWRTGDAALRPFHVFQLASFWKHYLPVWQEWLGQWLPAAVAKPLGSIACAAAVFGGTCGVRLLAIPYLWRGDRARRDPLLVGWMGAFFAVSAGLGMLIELNSYGELYVLLMMRLPLAVLTAAFFVAAGRWYVARVNARRQAAPSAAGVSRGRAAAGVFAHDHVAGVFADHSVAGVFAGRAAPPRVVFWIQRVALGGAVGAVALAGAVQTRLWWTLNTAGWREFVHTPTDLKPDAYMQELQEALLWVRHHTEPNAVLVANACTAENMKKDHWGALDRTLTGVHFYYSALSERRLWFEGPNYILDTTRARLRASIASNFFYRGRPLCPATVSASPTYVLLDLSLADGARVPLPSAHRMFSNPRVEVYRLVETPASTAPLAGPTVAVGLSRE